MIALAYYGTSEARILSCVVNPITLRLIHQRCRRPNPFLRGRVYRLRHNFGPPKIAIALTVNCVV